MPVLASSTATRTSNSLKSRPSMTIRPQAWHFSAGSCAVKLWPPASMVSSSVMGTTLSRSHRRPLFMARFPPSPCRLGRGWERLLRAAEVAGNEGKLHLRGERGDVALCGVAEQTDDYVADVVAAQPRRHVAQLASEEHLQQQRLDQIVPMMSERDLRAAQLAGSA